MLLALGGCAMSTPAIWGSIGGVEDPAGVYLLAQYNSYNTASGLADLATGETANDVKTVLKAQCTGTINGEEVTTDGADYISQLTTHAIEYYAAVEKEFDELGGVLDDAAHRRGCQLCRQPVEFQRRPVHRQRHFQVHGGDLPAERPEGQGHPEPDLRRRRAPAP